MSCDAIKRRFISVDDGEQAARVCVVGPGTRFLSGISYYTIRLANVLASSHEVSVILMRQLLPTRFYPGRRRVGMGLTQLEYVPSVRVFDGVDWFWLPTIFSALIFLIRQGPEVIVFQWWTGTVLHTYLVLALVARLLGVRMVIEFHEMLDTAEARMAFAQTYVGLLIPWLIKLAGGFVIHSEYDRAIVKRKYRLGNRPIAVIPHGPYDHYRLDGREQHFREAPESCLNLLFFGVIRPFKGLEDLIIAFDTIPESEICQYWLTVVGEPWEGWTLPAELIAQSRYRDRITFVDRYVSDEEVAAFFNGADAVVLPYHRSSASGPLHTAMSWGLPVVVTQVGGLPEAVADYEGAILVPPRDPPAIRNAIKQIASPRGKHFDDPHSWERTARLYDGLFAALAGNQSRREEREA